MYKLPLAVVSLALVTACNNSSSGGTAKSHEEQSPDQASIEGPEMESSGAKQLAPGQPKMKIARESAKLGQQSEKYGLKSGDPVPQSEAEDIQGKSVSLDSLTEGGPLLLIFYRGGWCPYCNFQIRAMAHAHKSLKSRGVSIAMVSVDEVSESAKTTQAFKLPFPVLSDRSGKMHEAFQVLDHAKKRAIPSLFVLSEGRVVFSHVDEDYQKRPSESQVLAMLDELEL